MNEEKTEQPGAWYYISQLLTVFGFAFFGLFFFTFIAVYFCKPLFGVDVMSDTSLLNQPTNDPKLINAIRFVQMMVTFGTFGGPVLAYLKLGRMPAAPFLKLNVYPGFLTAAIAILFSVVSLFFVNWMAEWNQAIQLPSFLNVLEEQMRAAENKAELMTKTLLNMQSNSDFIFNLFVVALMPAICEEFMFRGLLQKIFSLWTGNVHAAVFLSAFIFSFIHFQFYGFIPRLLLGAAYGYLFWWSGSLWVTILAHFINNGLQVLIAWMAKWNPQAKYLADTEHFPLWVNLSSMVATVGLFAVLFLLRKKEKEIQSITEDSSADLSE